MSLYLVIFDSAGQELDGWVLGHYSDFGAFRQIITERLDPASYPILLSHSDCEGEWSAAELPRLKQELLEIAVVLKALPPEQPVNSFEHTEQWRASANSLLGCFHNIDGENLVEALIRLCDIGIETGNPIILQ